MKVETAFDPAGNLIIVEGAISGPLGDAPLRLVLDTGASESLVVPDIVDALGYSPRDAEVLTGVYSAVGKEQGYMLRVARFSALGFTIPDVRIHVFDLPDRYGIDGLLGLSPRWTGQIRPVVDGSNPASCSRTRSRSSGAFSPASRRVASFASSAVRT